MTYQERKQLRRLERRQIKGDKPTYPTEQGREYGGNECPDREDRSKGLGVQNRNAEDKSEASVEHLRYQHKGDTVRAEKGFRGHQLESG